MDILKEKKIVTHLSNGLKLKEIGTKEYASVKTVQNWTRELEIKYNCKTLSQLVAKFIREKIIN